LGGFPFPPFPEGLGFFLNCIGFSFSVPDADTVHIVAFHEGLKLRVFGLEPAVNKLDVHPD
jgi:hypothetical protein